MRPATASQIRLDAEIRGARDDRRVGSGGEDGETVIDCRGAGKAIRCDRSDARRRPLESIAKLTRRRRTERKRRVADRTVSSAPAQVAGEREWIAWTVAAGTVL